MVLPIEQGTFDQKNRVDREDEFDRIEPTVRNGADNSTS